MMSGLDLRIASREGDVAALDLDIEAAIRARVTRRQADGRTSKLVITQDDALQRVWIVTAQPEGLGGVTRHTVSIEPSPPGGRYYMAEVTDHRLRVSQPPNDRKWGASGCACPPGPPPGDNPGHPAMALAWVN